MDYRRAIWILGSGVVAMSIVGVVGEDWVQISAGSTMYLGRFEDETWAWGDNFYGNIGNNSRNTAYTPVSVFGGYAFSKVETSASQCGAIRRSDGTGWAWGNNTYGNLGTNNRVSYSSPVSVVGGNSYREISTSPGEHTLYILGSDGTGRSAGRNGTGELGDNSRTSRSSPVSVVGGKSFSRIYAKFSCSFFIDGSNGSAWSCGRNDLGQLGDNSRTSRSSPVSVVGAISYSRLACGSGIAAFMAGINGANGSAWAWGSNAYGQLGDGSTDSRSSPVSVLGGNSYVDIALSGGDCIYAIRGDDGSLWSWGRNDYGTLGTGDGAPRSSPVSVIGGHSFISVGGTINGGIALKADGTIWMWGANRAFCSLGVPVRSTPCSVYLSSPVNLCKCITEVPYGLLRGDGIILMGSNIAATDGSLGDNRTDKANPVALPICDGVSYSDCAIGNGHGIAIRGSDKTAWAWGLNSSGQLGDNSATNKSSPVSVVGGMSYNSVIASTCSVAINAADGTVWAWGQNTVGSLGDGTRTVRSSPVSTLLAGSCVAIAMSSGRSVWAILASDGSVWAWGAGNNGNLGHGDYTSYSSPVSMLGGISFSCVSGGQYHFLGINGADGSAWACGYNLYGQLGDGSRTDRSSPVSVLGGHSFVKVAAGQGFSLGRKADGSVWGWGSNEYWQLGNGTTTSCSSPVSALGGSWADIEAAGNTSMFKDASGYVWSAGYYTGIGNDFNNVLSPRLISKLPG
jgi:alpha-tubulin suppressor-like RCC1 family protein